MPKRIIIAEDDLSVRLLYVLHLTRGTDFLVDAFENGEQALERMRYEKRNGIDYDWVFTDYEMPVMDGLDLTRRIRSEFGKTPSIAILSGREEIRAKALEAGANAFFVKPANLMELDLLIKGLQPPQEDGYSNSEQ
jgi:two-component system sensor histidine kinase EvgS